MSTVVDTTRPSRAEVQPAAVDLVQRHGAEIMAVARRYSTTPEDAEDAYQRGLEILLTKAPSTRADDLVPWLKTVVKHEAFALHRARERAGQPTEPDRIASEAGSRRAGTGPPEEHAERLERLQIGAEALGRLKPQEIRCMLLLAEGHTYKQIQELTGFSYTKVNRCLTEGRRSFVRRVEGIESGEECDRLAPLISALADGETSAKDMAILRPHLRTCLSCRAALRDAREVPARVAVLAPIGLLATGAPPHGGRFWAPLRHAWEGLSDRLTSLALRGQDVIETASAHKFAAAAASAAALGGGGIATVEMGAGHVHHPKPHVAAAPKARKVIGRLPAPVPRWRPAAVVSKPAPAARHASRTRGGPGPTKPRPVQEEPQPSAPPIAATEPVRPAAPAPARAPAADPQTGEFGP